MNEPYQHKWSKTCAPASVDHDIAGHLLVMLVNHSTLLKPSVLLFLIKNVHKTPKA